MGTEIHTTSLTRGWYVNRASSREIDPLINSLLWLLLAIIISLKFVLVLPEFMLRLWKEGRKTGLWVRRFYILLRREQIDEMDGAASNVVHELCCFQTDTEFSECLSSIVLEEAIRFENGPEAGLPEHVRQALSAQRSAAGRRGQLKNSASNKAKKKTMFDGLYNALATRWDTDDLKDYTLLLTMKDRQVRLRPETKSAYDTWSALLGQLVPQVRTQPMFEGWVWRRLKSYSWKQRYAILHDGVLFYFVSAEESEKFKLVASRNEDAMFIATPLAEAIISLEHTECVQSAPFEDRVFVFNFKCEDPPLDEYISVVDEAQLNAWQLAVRNARHWFEHIADDHPTRRLFGGLGGGDDEGPMLASNVNPLASRENQEKASIRRALFGKMDKAGHLVDEATLEVLFHEADTDQNGVLSMSELREMMTSKLDLTVDDREWRILVESLDRDGNGTVSLSEFRTWYLANAPNRPAVRAAVEQAEADAEEENMLAAQQGAGAAGAGAGAAAVGGVVQGQQGGVYQTSGNHLRTSTTRPGAGAGGPSSTDDYFHVLVTHQNDSAMAAAPGGLDLSAFTSTSESSQQQQQYHSGWYRAAQGSFATGVELMPMQQIGVDGQ